MQRIRLNRIYPGNPWPRNGVECGGLDDNEQRFHRVGSPAPGPRPVTAANGNSGFVSGGAGIVRWDIEGRTAKNMSKQVFISLPVADLSRSLAFFQALGYAHNPAFTDETAACIVINDTTFVMLLTHAKWRSFTTDRKSVV